MNNSIHCYSTYLKKSNYQTIFEKFEDTKGGIIRGRKSKDRQFNCQKNKKTNKQTNKQNKQKTNTTQKIKIE